MKNRPDNWEIDQLLSSKSYDQLSEAQKNALEAQGIDQENYQSLQATLQATQRNFKEERTRVKPAVQRKLRAKFKEQHAPRRHLGSFVNYQIPLWQAMAAAMVVLFFFVQMTRAEEYQPTEPLVVYQTDTVYKAMPVAQSISPVDSIVDILSPKRITKRKATYTHNRPTNKAPKPVSPPKSMPPSFALQLNENYDTAVLNKVIDDYLQDDVRDRRRIKVDSGLLRQVGQVY